MEENVINKLTGNPVSDAMRAVIDTLNKNVYVSQDEIQRLPEMEYAKLCVNQSVMSKEELKRREPIQENVLQRLENNIKSAVTQSDGTVLFNGEIRREKRLDVVIGLPAAGKSTALAEPLSEFYKSRLIDADEAKKLLPNYDQGWGAGYVHEESKQIADRQFKRAIQNGENIVYPRVGGDLKSTESYIRQAKNAGYKVYVHYNELSRNKALARLLTRFLETGRFLPPSLVEDGAGIQNTYNQLVDKYGKGERLIDGFSHWNNDVPRNERPILEDYSRSCEDFCQAHSAPSIGAQSTGAVTVADVAQKVEIEKLREENNSLRNTVQKLTKDVQTLRDKIDEVNEVLVRNPELLKKYKEKRDEYRADKQSRQAQQQTKQTKPKKPSL